MSTLRFRFRNAWQTGILLQIFFLFTGIMLCRSNYLPHHSAWIGHHYKNQHAVLVQLNEPLIPKPNSYKAVAQTLQLISDAGSRSATGNIIIYFQKDSSIPDLHYGDQLIIYKPLQLIQNSGNPGAFDYKRYCAFQQIFHQVYLTHNEWIKYHKSKPHPLQRFIFNTRKKIVQIILRYIPGRREAGLAEALLIGYKDDLDKDLVQAYSNTGVVHVIAISGLHLGLIYWLLALILKPILHRKKIRWLQPVLIITGLWLFSLLSGASASVMRSAVMFTCIVLGEAAQRKISVYNSLAASAFLLLCYQPFWLWDVGFQLSYIAVLSIVLFNKPIYNLLFVSNKILDAIWKVTAVTLSAQILTTPVSIYYFHQFPLYFLLSNLLAIPLSSLILLGELVLVACCWWANAAISLGWLLHYCIKAMNGVVEYISQLPFSAIKHLYISIPQVWLLYFMIAGIAYACMNKNRKAWLCALCGWLLFIMFGSYHKWICANQQKIIAYNISKHTAIEVLAGKRAVLFADSSLLGNPALQDVHISASRLLHGIHNSRSFLTPALFRFAGVTWLFIDRPFTSDPPEEKLKADWVIIAQNPRITIRQLCRFVDCRQFIIDATNSATRAARWQKECEESGLFSYALPLQGAFVMNLPSLTFAPHKKGIPTGLDSAGNAFQPTKYE